MIRVELSSTRIIPPCAVLPHIYPAKQNKKEGTSMSVRRARSPINSYLRSTRGPVSLVLEGALLILIGVVIAVLNANNTGHIQKVSGRIDSVDNTGSTLTLAGQQDLYNYVQSDLNTSWVPNEGDQVTLYYEDTTPKLIVAVQEYDQSGH